jgi:hypothetical protein
MYMTTLKPQVQCHHTFITVAHQGPEDPYPAEYTYAIPLAPRENNDNLLGEDPALHLYYALEENVKEILTHESWLEQQRHEMLCVTSRSL